LKIIEVKIKNDEGHVVDKRNKKSTIGYIFVPPRELGLTIKAREAQRKRWSKVRYI